MNGVRDVVASVVHDGAALDMLRRDPDATARVLGLSHSHADALRSADRFFQSEKPIFDRAAVARPGAQPGPHVFVRAESVGATITTSADTGTLLPGPNTGTYTISSSASITTTSRPPVAPSAPAPPRAPVVPASPAPPIAPSAPVVPTAPSAPLPPTAPSVPLPPQVPPQWPAPRPTGAPPTVCREHPSCSCQPVIAAIAAITANVAATANTAIVAITSTAAGARPACTLSCGARAAR